MMLLRRISPIRQGLSIVSAKITVAQAAAILKVSRRRVVAMIGAGILEAEKFGERVWMIDAESVKKRQEKMKGKKNED